MSESTTATVPTTRVTQNWPTELKEAVEAVAGKRGGTEFTLAAVRDRLSSSDRLLELDQELNDARYLCQLLADRYAMGGTAADRESALMEVELPSWLDTKGWPEALAKQVAKPVAPKPQPVVQPPPATVQVDLNGEPEKPAAPERIPCPYHKQGQQCEHEARHKGKHHAGDLEWGEETQTLADRAERQVGEMPAGDALLARVQAKAAEKGIDLGGAGLVPASTIEQPEAKHNHAWAEIAHPSAGYIGKAYECECGATMDDKRVYEPGEVPEPTTIDPEIAAAYDVPPDQVDSIDREAVDLVTPAEDASEPAPGLDVPADAATPVEGLCPKCKEPLVAGECWNC